jgi:hypothetical protein
MRGNTLLISYRICPQSFNDVKMLDVYYKLRGWDKEGRPTKQTIDKLGSSSGPV